jgi:integrase
MARWHWIAERCPLPVDLTLPYVLRHSFASLAGDSGRRVAFLAASRYRREDRRATPLGYSEPTIAALVGHKGRTITSRYVHAADAVLLAAADAVALRTVELMGESLSADATRMPIRVEG